MQKTLIGILLWLMALVGTPALAAENDAAKSEAAKNGDQIETVRKTCECVRRHPSGFPYIESRITTCKTYKSAQGHVKSLDCTNCYSLCSDKPTS
jgi:hypothetical protein